MVRKKRGTRFIRESGTNPSKSALTEQRRLHHQQVVNCMPLHSGLQAVDRQPLESASSYSVATVFRGNPFNHQPSILMAPWIQ
jgi:hypothetical protein